MFYAGSVQDVETIVSNVLANATCLIVKQLPKESAFKKGHLMVTTGRDYFMFDLGIIIDQRDNTGRIEIYRNSSVSRLCGISPEINAAFNRLHPVNSKGQQIIQQYNGNPVRVESRR